MADVVTDRGAGSGTTLLGWVAVILAVLALVLAWMAYDRTGANLDERIQQEVQRGVDGTQETQDATEQETTPDATEESTTPDTTEPTNPDTTEPTTPDTTQ
jgi:cytoskeletal protein RodZ